MRPQNVIFVVVALVVAAGLALFARSLMRPAQAPVHQAAVKEAPTTKILVAADHIGPGEFLKPDLFEWKVWPTAALDERFIVKDKFKETDVVGAVARQALEKGDPIFTSKIIKPGEGGFLAAVLKPGMRAVSVSVNRATGNAGLIMPGDLVDLVLTGKLDPQGPDDRVEYVGQTVLHKLRVLAIDQTLDSKDQAQVAQTATLEVTPKDAEKVLVAEQLGQLSLVLRSFAKPETENAQLAEDVTPEVTWDREVSLALKKADRAPRRSSAPTPERPSVVVMRGNRRSDVPTAPAAPAPMIPNLASAFSSDSPATVPGQ